MNKEVAKIRRASIDEFMALWQYSNSNTYTYFLKGMKTENIEFWTIDCDNKLVGELYVFWDSEDKDEADGFKRAYLCAFRVSPDYQGRGLSSLLMKRVIKRISERGFNEVTIGIDNNHYEKLVIMYKKWGFDHLIKTQTIDYHYRDKDNQPYVYDQATELYMKTLND